MRNGPLFVMALVFALGVVDEEYGHHYDWRSALVSACAWLTGPLS